jgi:hypothetical protein
MNCSSAQTPTVSDRVCDSFRRSAFHQLNESQRECLSMELGPRRERETVLRDANVNFFHVILERLRARSSSANRKFFAMGSGRLFGESILQDVLNLWITGRSPTPPAGFARRAPDSGTPTHPAYGGEGNATLAVAIAQYGGLPRKRVHPTGRWQPGLPMNLPTCDGCRAAAVCARA